MKSLKDRRTIRLYQKREVDESVLYEMVEEAMRTSTTGNMQLYSVIVSSSDEEKKALAPLHFNQPCVTQASALLTICADFNRFTKWCEFRNAQPGYANFLSFITAATDALIFSQSLSMLAEERGLGICYLGTVIYNAQGFIDFFNLPQLVVPVAALTVGYPNVVPPQPDRLPVEAVLHRGKYSDYNKDKIDALYRVKEELRENKHFVGENNKETLAQVFTDIRYKKEDNELFSERYLEAIRRQGFLE